MNECYWSTVDEPSILKMSEYLQILVVNKKQDNGTVYLDVGYLVVKCLSLITSCDGCCPESTCPNALQCIISLFGVV